jgi:hypothetical protein
MEKLYYTVDDVTVLLGIAKPTAYKIVQQLNKELKEKGYIVVAGRISRKYFEERCY